MILYPLNSSCQFLSESNCTSPVWEAIECRQRLEAGSWWLIGQSDHAALAGDLACHLVCDDFPRLDPEVIRAISLHDEGWVPFDREAITGAHGKGGRPLSFVEMPTTDYLEAWKASIERAQQDSYIGGLLVSKHFCRIAHGALSSQDRREYKQMLQEFLDQESVRHANLFRQQTRTMEEIQALTDVLQFFDLLSLYLCCGSQESAIFPQSFRCQTICIRRQDEGFRTEPSLFGRGVSLGITARSYPAKAVTSSISIPILIT
jgi:hypothetical protein